MKRNIALYIGTRKADLDDKSFILLNYGIDDLTDPTVVRNTFSKTVTLPGTPANNAIFGDAYRPDRQGGGGGTGPDFNAGKKTSFTVYADTGEMLESGYVKLGGVTGWGADARYKVTLYGGLGSFLQNLTYLQQGDEKMQLSDLDYYTGGDDELDFVIDAQTVADAWSIDPDAGTIDSIWKVIQFVPSLNGVPEGNFDADKAVIRPADYSLQTTAVQDNIPYHTTDGYALMTLAGKVDEWAAKDLRSYLQRPALSVRAFLHAIEDPLITGYNLVYRSQWQYLDTWITLPLLPSMVKSAMVTEVGYTVQTWQAYDLDAPMARYTLTAVPVGAEVSASLNFRFRTWPTDTAAPSPLIGSYLSTSGGVTSGPMTVIFLQAVAYNGGTEVGSSGNLCIFWDNLFSGTGSYATTAEYLAAACQYTPVGTNEDVVPISMSTFDSTGSAGDPFQLSQDLNLFLTATDAQTIEVYAACYTVNVRKVSDGGGGWTSQTVTGVTADDATPVMYGGPTAYSTSKSTIVETAAGASVSYTASDIRSGETITKSMLLSTGHTPAEYLLALVKTFGLYLLVDENTKTVTIADRNDTYGGGKDVDLTGRVDLSQEVTLTPTTKEVRWYAFAPDVVKGEFTEFYGQIYGTAHGSMLVDTGYEINAGTKNLAAGSLLKSAATVLSRSRYNNVLQQYGGFRPSVMLDTGNTYALRNASGNSLDFPVPTASSASITYYNPTYPGYDYAGAVKLQFADADGKASDGSHVLVRRIGTATYPYLKLSDDTLTMNRINSGRACWDLTPGNAAGITIPVFSRFTFSGANITDSLEFGPLREYALPGLGTVTADATVYGKCWKAFIADRYGRHAKTVRIKVDFSGMQVGRPLLRNFYFFGGCWWVLTKIINHSVTTDDLTECEFVLVTSKTAYTNGQS